MELQPHLTFHAECEEAFRFYETCLGGTITIMMNHADMPTAEAVPPGWEKAIMHARLEIGDAVLLGMDAPRESCARPQGAHVSLQVDTPEEADRIFEAFSENGQIQMPIGKTFWAERFGMVVDRFGTPWMIGCSPIAS